jgi:amidohydrolase
MHQSTLIQSVKRLANDIYPGLVGFRRHLHAHPELSFEEANTGQFIATRLKEWQIPHTTGWGGHGVVGILDSGRPGPVIALRADIDALPIHEISDKPYKSQAPGVMHACGHDAHTSSLLGAASILNELKEHWNGQVKLIFQPGEEKLPGGASLIIKEGVLENPKPEIIYGQHVQPQLAAGKVGFKEGMFMASADELYFTIEGRGGHGAQPHLTIDPIVLASTLITTLQQIVSRNANPLLPTVLTFGKIWSDGGATNIIPDRVHIYGTLRTLDEPWRKEAHRLLERSAHGLIEALGGQCSLEIRKGYPPLYNDPGATADARQLAEMYLGPEQVVDMDILMGAEDFAYYSQQMPACFYRLGTGNPDGGKVTGLHTPDFDIHESALEIGAGLMAWIALGKLMN